MWVRTWLFKESDLALTGVWRFVAISAIKNFNKKNILNQSATTKTAAIMRTCSGKINDENGTKIALLYVRFPARPYNPQWTPVFPHSTDHAQLRPPPPLTTHNWGAYPLWQNKYTLKELVEGQKWWKIHKNRPSICGPRPPCNHNGRQLFHLHWSRTHLSPPHNTQLGAYPLWQNKYTLKG